MNEIMDTNNYRKDKSLDELELIEQDEVLEDMADADRGRIFEEEISNKE